MVSQPPRDIQLLPDLRCHKELQGRAQAPVSMGESHFCWRDPQSGNAHCLASSPGPTVLTQVGYAQAAWHTLPSSLCHSTPRPGPQTQVGHPDSGPCGFSNLWFQLFPSKLS